MSGSRARPSAARVFGLNDWIGWLDELSRRLFGLSAEEFEAAYDAGALGAASAHDLASALPLIRRLRAREQVER